MPISDRIINIHAIPKPLLAKQAHGMDPSDLAFLPAHPINPADVPGGCAGAPEPIRGCDRTGAPTKVLMHLPWRTTNPARERAGEPAQTPGAFAHAPA